jgi:hypothetical protein
VKQRLRCGGGDEAKEATELRCKKEREGVGTDVRVNVAGFYTRRGLLPLAMGQNEASPSVLTNR